MAAAEADLPSSPLAERPRGRRVSTGGGVDPSVELMDAAREGDIERVKEAIELAKAKINFQDAMGQTALHIAVYRSHPEVVEYLVLRGVDTDLRSNDDLTAYQLAVAEGEKDCASLIRTRARDLKRIRTNHRRKSWKLETDKLIAAVEHRRAATEGKKARAREAIEESRRAREVRQTARSAVATARADAEAADAEQRGRTAEGWKRTALGDEAAGRIRTVTMESDGHRMQEGRVDRIVRRALSAFAEGIGGFGALRDNKRRAKAGDIVAGISPEVAARLVAMSRAFVARRQKERLASLPGCESGGKLVAEGIDPAAVFKRSVRKVKTAARLGAVMRALTTAGPRSGAGIASQSAAPSSSVWAASKPGAAPGAGLPSAPGSPAVTRTSTSASTSSTAAVTSSASAARQAAASLLKELEDDDDDDDDDSDDDDSDDEAGAPFVSSPAAGEREGKEQRPSPASSKSSGASSSVRGDATAPPAARRAAAPAAAAVSPRLAPLQPRAPAPSPAAASAAPSPGPARRLVEASAPPSSPLAVSPVRPHAPAASSASSSSPRAGSASARDRVAEAARAAEAAAPGTGSMGAATAVGDAIGATSAEAAGAAAGVAAPRDEQSLTPSELALLGTPDSRRDGAPHDVASIAARRAEAARRLWQAAHEVANPGVVAAVAAAARGGSEEACRAGAETVRFWLRSMLLERYADGMVSSGFDTMERVAMLQREDLGTVFRLVDADETLADPRAAPRKRKGRTRMPPGHLRQLLRAAHRIRVYMDAADVEALAEEADGLGELGSPLGL